MSVDTSRWAFWRRELSERTVTFELDVEQAAALRRELQSLLRLELDLPIEQIPETPRLDLLCLKLGGDIDYLRSIAARSKHEEAAR
jgi:hypothetical protein